MKEFENKGNIKVDKHFKIKDGVLTFLLGLEGQFINLERVKNYAVELGMEPKDDFHLTVIGNKTGEEIFDLIKDLPEEERRIVIEKIENLISTTEFSVNFGNSYYAIKKDYEYPEEREEKRFETREAIIQMAELVNLDTFYEKLNTLLGTNFEIPLSHITLFSKSTNPENMKRGIGIYSIEYLKSLKPKKLEL